MKTTALVNKMILPLYENSGTWGIRTDELLYGMQVFIYQTKEPDRYRVETDYHYTGLVDQSGLVLGKREIRDWNNNPKLTVKRSCCDVMSAPAVKSTVLLSVCRGCRLIDYGDAEDGYHCVGLTDGTRGYLRNEYFLQENTTEAETGTLNQETAVRRRLIETALSYFGTPYRWGGKTPFGIDCSGLTFMCYALNGILIHRDSTWLPDSSIRKIADCERKPGDLLYFPGHIAMYLGNGEYIHSTAKDGAGVTINSLVKGSNLFREDLYHSYLFSGSLEGRSTCDSGFTL